MKIENENGSIECAGAGRIVVRLGGDVRFRGMAGVVVPVNAGEMNPLASTALSQRIDETEDRCGIADRLHLSAAGSEKMRVEMIWSLYREQPVAMVEMVVSNESSQDVKLDRIIYLRGFGGEGGFDGAFPRWPDCRVLNQPMHWHMDPPTEGHLRALPAGARVSAYWSTAIGDADGPGLAIGIAEAAKAAARITFGADDGHVGLEISADLRTGAGINQPLRLPAGKSFTAHRMIVLPAKTPMLALDRYADWVCRFLDWKLRFPPYSGLFAAYGSNREGALSNNNSLSETRIDELMAVVKKYLAPYGLDTIKTQFQGYSSSRPDGKPIENPLTAEEAKDPKKVRALVAAIHDRAFAPDDYDSRKDYTHGIGWHVKQLASEGYRPALVCRPFYNIKAGSPELDRAAADLFEMAVREWGYQYLMFDFNNHDYSSDNDTITIEQGIYSRFKAVRDRVGPDIFIEACMIWPGPVLGVADGYRPARDWRGCIEESLAPFFACRNHYHGKFFQCDNEFIHPALKPFTWNEWEGQRVICTLDRLRLWVGFNAILGFSYLTGGVLEQVDAERWWIFQRALPAQIGRATALDLFRNTPPQRWIRAAATAAGEFHVLGLFNWSAIEPRTETVDAGEWGLDSAKQHLFFDFWTQEVYGPAKAVPAFLAPFSGRIFQVTPVGHHPTLVGNTRHITGQVGIDKWDWQWQTRTITATFAGAPGSSERYWIWLAGLTNADKFREHGSGERAWTTLPGREGVEQCLGANYEMIRPRLLRLEVSFDATGRQEVTLRLNTTTLVP